MTTLKLLAYSVIRSLLGLLAGYLVHHNLAEPELVNDAVGMLTFLLVDKAIELYLAHQAELKRAIYQKWLVVLGLRTTAASTPAVVQSIKDDAHYLTRQGMVPVMEKPTVTVPGGPPEVVVLVGPKDGGPLL